MIVLSISSISVNLNITALQKRVVISPSHMIQFQAPPPQPQKKSYIGFFHEPIIKSLNIAFLAQSASKNLGRRVKSQASFSVSKSTYCFCNIDLQTSKQ